MPEKIDNSSEEISPLKQDLDSARADIAAIRERLLHEPDVLKEVAQNIWVAVEVPNRPWLRNGLMAEKKSIVRLQQDEHLKFMKKEFPQTEDDRGRIKHLVDWCIGRSDEEPQYRGEGKKYDPPYKRELLDNITSVLTQSTDPINALEPAAAKSAEFQNEMHRIVQYFYLLFEAIRKRKQREDIIDITEEEMIANRVQVIACSEALHAIFNKYKLPNQHPHTKAFFEMTTIMCPIRDILRNHREYMEVTERQAAETNRMLDELEKSTGEA